MLFRQKQRCSCVSSMTVVCWREIYNGTFCCFHKRKEGPIRSEQILVNLGPVNILWINEKKQQNSPIFGICNLTIEKKKGKENKEDEERRKESANLLLDEDEGQRTKGFRSIGNLFWIRKLVVTQKKSRREHNPFTRKVTKLNQMVIRYSDVEQTTEGFDIWMVISLLKL